MAAFDKQEPLSRPGPAPTADGQSQMAAPQVDSERDLPDDDLAILRQIGRGDLRGFDRFVNRYKTRLLSYLCSRLGNYHAAEDLVQETFLRIFSAA